MLLRKQDTWRMAITQEEVHMRRTLLCTALAMALVAFGGPAQSAMPKIDGPSVSTLVEAVVCVGDRRDYRDFNHCWRVNNRRVRTSAAVRYCSRICGTGRPSP